MQFQNQQQHLHLPPGYDEYIHAQMTYAPPQRGSLNSASSAEQYVSGGIGTDVPPRVKQAVIKLRTPAGRVRLADVRVPETGDVSRSVILR